MQNVASSHADYNSEVKKGVTHRQPKLTLFARIMLRNSGHGINILSPKRKTFS